MKEPLLEIKRQMFIYKRVHREEERSTTDKSLPVNIRNVKHNSRVCASALTVDVRATMCTHDFSLACRSKQQQ